MSAILLFDLANLFSLESFVADKRGDSVEADRLWDIAAELQERFLEEDAP